jgi:hypothetical protein
MRITTIVILVIGSFVTAWSTFWGAGDLIFRPPSWGIDLTYADIGIGVGLCFVAVALLKWLLLDRLLGFPF